MLRKGLQPPKIDTKLVNELMQQSLPHDNISDLIYWYEVEEYGHEPSSRDIAKKVFKTRIEGY